MRTSILLAAAGTALGSAAAAAAGSALGSAAAAAAATGTALGCNALPPGNRNTLFADYVKTSLFGQPAIPGSQNTTVDALGWPTQDFSLLFYSEPGGYTYPAADLSGVHALTARGCATVSLPPAIGGLAILNQSCPGGDLLAYVQVSADGAAVGSRLALAFTATTRGAGAGAGLTNVSLLLPGYAPGTDPDTLHEPALANMRGRCALLRFLGWNFYGHTQWEGITPPTPCDWSQRPRLGAPSYALGGWGTYGAGVPYEILARIANAVGSDVWLNVPSTVNETARDEYVTSLLAQMDSELAPGKRIFLEYANECFFGNNQCYQDDTALANATVFERGDPYRLNYGLPSPPNASNLITHFNPRMYAYTALRFAQLAGGVVGGARVGRADAPGVRVVPVLGALQSYAGDGAAKLEWLSGAWGPPAAAGLATLNIGAYFAPARNVTTDPAVTTDAALDSLAAAIAAAAPSAPTAYSRSPLAGYAALSAYHGLALHAYEGGPDTSGGVGQAGQLALARACADARMADAVAAIIATWQAWGGGTFNYFDLGAQPLAQPWGSYANLWDLKVPDTPKSRGIDAAARAPPAPLAAGWPAPLLNHSAAFYVGYYTPSGLPPANPVVTWLPLGTEMTYLVRFPGGRAQCTAGLRVTVSLASRSKAGGDPLEVSVGEFLPSVTLVSPPMAGDRPAYADAVALFPALPAAALQSGLVAVRLRVPAAGVMYELRAVSVECR